MRSRIGAVLAVGMLATLTLVPGVAMAGTATGTADFVAQARADGLSAAQADGLQAKVDGYLAKYPGAKQTAPNRVDLKGAVISVTVPGEERPRPLGEASTNEYNAPECTPTADYKWFCAYEQSGRAGDNIGMYACDAYGIPWRTYGSWENNQTPGTQPLAYFVDGTWWNMPGAYHYVGSGVLWEPVAYIVNC